MDKVDIHFLLFLFSPLHIRMFSHQVMVTNAFTSALIGGSAGDPDFTLGIALSEDGNHTTGNNVLFNVTVDMDDASKLYDGIEAGDTVSLRLIGKVISFYLKKKAFSRTSFLWSLLWAIPHFYQRIPIMPIHNFCGGQPCLQPNIFAKNILLLIHFSSVHKVLQTDKSSLART